MKSITAVCLIICLCIATTLADEELVKRVKRVTCGGIVERLVGSKACDAHCRVIRKGEGHCSGGTCYCGRR